MEPLHVRQPSICAATDACQARHLLSSPTTLRWATRRHTGGLLRSSQSAECQPALLGFGQRCTQLAVQGNLSAMVHCAPTRSSLLEPVMQAAQPVWHCPAVQVRTQGKPQEERYQWFHVKVHGRCACSVSAAVTKGGATVGCQGCSSSSPILLMLWLCTGA
jgi:hypothetical protein